MTSRVHGSGVIYASNDVILKEINRNSIVVDVEGITHTLKVGDILTVTAHVILSQLSPPTLDEAKKVVKEWWNT